MKKFESQLYPYDLYVTLDPKDTGNLINIGTDKPLELSSDSYDGYSVQVKDSNTEKNGTLIYLDSSLNKRSMFAIAVHEIIHTIENYYNFIEEDLKGDEPAAYLAEWIAKCVYDTINESIKNN